MTAASTQSDPRLRARHERRLAAGFATAVALMLTAAYLSYRGVRGLTETAHRIARAGEIVRGVEGSAAAAARAKARGPERDAAERLADLRRLLADDPDGLLRLDAASKTDFRRSPDAFASALEAIAAPRRRVLLESEAGVDAQARALILVAAFARLIGACVVVVAFLLVRRYMAERTRAEAALVEARDAALRDAAVLRLAQEENLRLSDRLRAVLDHVESGVILVESNMTIALFNRTAERIHGAWRGEIERIWRSGQHPPLRLDGKTPLPSEENPLTRALKGETVLDERVFLRTPVRPEGYAIRLNAAPMRTEQGVITGAILVFREEPK